MKIYLYRLIDPDSKKTFVMAHTNKKYLRIDIIRRFYKQFKKEQSEEEFRFWLEKNKRFTLVAEKNFVNI